MHGLEAIAAPTHGAPTLPLRDSTIFEGITRLRRPTLKANAAPTRDAPRLALLPLRDRPISEGETRLHRPTLEANTAPTRDAPALSLRDSDDFKSETRLRCPTLNIQNHDPSAETGTPTVKYVEFYAGIGALSRSAEKHSGENAMLTEKDPVAQENLSAPTLPGRGDLLRRRRRFGMAHIRTQARSRARIVRRTTVPTFCDDRKGTDGRRSTRAAPARERRRRSLQALARHDCHRDRQQRRRRQ